jgi:hypothetical protein
MFVCWLYSESTTVFDLIMYPVPELRVKGGDVMPAFLISLRRVSRGLVMEGICGLSSVFFFLGKDTIAIYQHTILLLYKHVIAS